MSDFKKVKNKIYDYYHYFFNREEGVLWADFRSKLLKLAIVAALVITAQILIPTTILIFISVVIVSTSLISIGITLLIKSIDEDAINNIIQTKNNIKEAVNNAIENVKSFFYRLFTHKYTSVYTPPTVKDPFSKYDTNNHKIANQAEYDNLTVEDKIFMNICCNNLLPRGFPECSYSDYIRHISSIDKIFSDKEYTDLKSKLLFIKDTEKSSDAIKLIHQEFNNNKQVTFAGGYSKTIKTKDNEQDVEIGLIVDISKTENGLLVSILKNNDLTTNNQADIKDEKSHSHHTMQKFLIKNKNLSIENFTNSQLFKIVNSSRKGLKLGQIALNRYQFHITRLEEIKREKADLNQKFNQRNINREEYHNNIKRLEAEEDQITNQRLRCFASTPANTSFDSLAQEALMDLEYEAIRDDNQIINKSEISSNHNFTWKNLNNFIKNYIFKDSGNVFSNRKKIAYNNYLSYKLKLKFYILTSYYDNLIKSKKNMSAYQIDAIKYACADLSRLLEKHIRTGDLQNQHSLIDEIKNKILAIQTSLKSSQELTANNTTNNSYVSKLLTSLSIRMPKLSFKMSSLTKETPLKLDRYKPLPCPIHDQTDKYHNFDQLLEFCQNENIDKEYALISLENFINEIKIPLENFPLKNVSQYDKMNFIDLIYKISNLHAKLCKDAGKDKLRIQSQVCSLTLAHMIVIQGLESFNLVDVVDFGKAQELIQSMSDMISKTCTEKQLNLDPRLEYRKELVKSETLNYVNRTLIAAEYVAQRDTKYKENFITRIFQGKLSDICKMFNKPLLTNLIFRTCDEIITYQKMEYCLNISNSLNKQRYILDNLSIIPSKTLAKCVDVKTEIVNLFDQDPQKYINEQPILSSIVLFPKKLQTIYLDIIGAMIESDTIIIRIFGYLTIFTTAPFAIVTAVASNLIKYGALIATKNLVLRVKLESNVTQLHTENTNRDIDLISNTYLSCHNSLDQENNHDLNQIQGLPVKERFNQTGNFVGIKQLNFESKKYAINKEPSINEIHRLYYRQQFIQNPTLDIISLYACNDSEEVSTIYEVLVRHESYLNNHIFQDIIYANLFYGNSIESQIAKNYSAVIVLLNFLHDRIESLSENHKNTNIYNFYLKLFASLINHIDGLILVLEDKIANKPNDEDNRYTELLNSVKKVLQESEKNTNNIIDINSKIIKRNIELNNDIVDNYSYNIALLKHKSQQNLEKLDDKDICNFIASAIKLTTELKHINNNAYTPWIEIMDAKDLYQRNQKFLSEKLNGDLSLVKEIFARTTNNPTEEINSIKGEYPIFEVVTKNDDKPKYIDVVRFSLTTTSDSFCECPVSFIDKPDYVKYFGNNVYNGYLSNNGKRFTFSTNTKYTLNLIGDATNNILVISRTFKIDNIDASYVLVGSDVLKDQIPATITNNKNYSFWHNPINNTVIICNNTNNTVEYLANKNSVINYSTKEELICLKTNFNNVNIQALAKIELLGNIELWHDKINNKYRYALPRLNLEFISSDNNQSLIYSNDHQYKLNAETQPGYLGKYEKYLTLTPLNNKASSENKIIAPKYGVFNNNFVINNDSFLKTLKIFTADISTFFSTNFEKNKVVSIEAHDNSLSNDETCNIFIVKDNILLPENSGEGYFQLAAIYFYNNSVDKCIKALENGNINTDISLNELYWLNSIVSSTKNSPAATAAKAYAAAIINEKYSHIVPEELEWFLALNILSVIYQYYRVLNNIPHQFTLPPSIQALLLSKINTKLKTIAMNADGINMEKFNKIYIFSEEKLKQIYDLYIKGKIEYTFDFFKEQSILNMHKFQREHGKLSDKKQKIHAIENIEDHINKFIKENIENKLESLAAKTDDATSGPHQKYTADLEISDDNQDTHIKQKTYKDIFNDEFLQDREKGALLNKERNEFLDTYRSILDDNTFIESIVTNASIDVQKSEAELQNMKRNILEFATDALSKDSEYQLRIMQDLSTTPTFDRILYWFAQGNIESYKNETKLENDRIQELHNMVYKFLELATFNQFLTRLNNKLIEYRTCSNTNRTYIKDELCLIISQKRAYSLKEKPLYLLFEYYNNILLRDFQLSHIEELSNTDINTLLQIIMGAGKTTTIIPLIAQLQADGDNLSMIMVSNELLNTNYRDMSKKLLKTFNQRMYIFDFNRDTPHDPEHLRNILLELNIAKNERYCVITTPTAIQSFYLRYIEESIKNNQHESVSVLKDILRLFMEHTNLIGDEADTIFNIRKELNYSIEDKSLNEIYPDFAKDSIKICNDILKYSEDFYGYIRGNIKNKPALVSEEDRRRFTEEILKSILQNDENIIKSIAKEYHLEIALNEKEVFDYLINKNTGLPTNLLNINHNAKQRLAALRAVFTDYMPLFLTKHINENYGFRKDPDNIYNSHIAVPYVSANTPSKASEFSSEFESVFYTIFTFFEQSISKELFVTALRDMLKTRDEFSESNILDLNNTDDKSCAEYKKIVNMLEVICKNSSIGNIREDNIVSFYENNNNLHELKCYILEYLILPSIKIDTKQLSANMYDILNLFKSIRGITGTTYNKHTLTPIMNNSDTHTHGTDGKTIANIIKNTESVSHVTPDTKPSELLNAYKDSNVHAIIDQGAFFKNYSNLAIAKEVAQFLISNRSGIKQILYFNTNNILCALSVQQPHSVIELGNSNEEVVNQKTQTTIDERFVIYDNSHTTGVDIKQPPEAHALITLNEHDFLRNVLQSSMRMRNLPGSQKLHFLLPQGLSHIKTAEQIIELAHNNQTELLAADHLLATKNKLFAIIKTNLLKNTLYNKDRTRFLDNNYQRAFINEANNDLFTTYGEVGTLENLKQYLDKYKNDLLTRWADLFHNYSNNRQASVEEQMEQIINSALNICKPEVLSSLAQRSNTTKTVERQKIKEKQTQKEKEMQMMHDRQGENYRTRNHVSVDYEGFLNPKLLQASFDEEKIYVKQKEFDQLARIHGTNNPKKSVFDQFTKMTYSNDPEECRIYRLKQNLQNYPKTEIISDNIFITYDALSPDNPDSILPFMNIMYLRDQAKNKSYYVILAPSEDLADAQEHFPNLDNLANLANFANLANYQMEIFTLNGALIYSNFAKDNKSVKDIMEKHNAVINILSSIDPQLHLLKQFNTLANEQNRKLVEKSYDKNPIMQQRAKMLASYALKNEQLKEQRASYNDDNPDNTPSASRP